MIKNKTNQLFFKTLIIITVGILFSFTIKNNVSAKENYIVALVNNLPITKIDVMDRAKLISYSLDQNTKFINLHMFYDQSLQSLITDNVKKHAGLKYNNINLNSISKEAYLITLSDYQNSEMVLNDFINKLSISKASIVNRYETEIIWKNVLQNKFKQQFINIDHEIKKIIKLNEIEKNKDKYQLAEIVIPRKNNLALFNEIISSLKKGANFSQIAKQVSISPSSKFGGQIGWKTFQNLPDQLKKENTVINEGNIFNFTKKNKINIIKILVKRNKGKVSSIENKVLLAEINFQINFGDKDQIYSRIKDKVLFLLKDKKNCNALKKINIEKNVGLTLKVIQARIADMDFNIQKSLKNIKQFDHIGPIYKGNSGFLFVFCDQKKVILKDINPNLIKKQLIDKRFVIFNEKLIKKLIQNAKIKIINPIK